MMVEELEGYKYTELQVLAKKHGLRANGGKEHLVQQLAAYFEEQAAASTSRTTRSASKSVKRGPRDPGPSMDDEADDSTPDPPPARRTRSGLHSKETPSNVNDPPATAQRTRSRVVSSVAPRAALVRTTSQSRLKPTFSFDSATEQESSIINATPPPPVLLSRKKALDSQRRLGVGRPRAIGGSGVRKSTARAKSASTKPASSGRIVEVVVPTLQAVREEEAAAVSRASVVKQSIEQDEEDDEDDRTSTPPPPPLRTKPILPPTSPPRGHDTSTSVAARLSALEDRIDKSDSALEVERRRVAVLYARVGKLETENRRLRDDLDALNQQSEAEKQIVSETPQTPSSRVPTPPPAEKENDRPSGEALKAPAHNQARSSAIQSLNHTPLQPTPTDSPSRQPTDAGSPKILRPPPESRNHSPMPPKQNPVGATAATPGRVRLNQLGGFEVTMTSQSPKTNLTTVVPPQSPTPAHKTLGKHPRDAKDSPDAVSDNGETGTPADHTPKKRRRVDVELQRREADAEDVDMDGEPVNVDVEDVPERPAVLVRVARQTSLTRASSQPARSAGGARPNTRTSVEPDSTRVARRRTRAGSAAPAVSRPNQRATGAARQLGTVTEGDAEANLALPSTFNPQHPISLAPIDPLPLPRTQDSSVPPFVTYPLPGDPVKELKPLTHFDSGTEFFGTRSKQNYKTDWHEGTVFDDPFDADTVRRAQGIAAEEVQGGFGPQGLDGIADGLEERDEQEALGVRGMMSFVGEGDAGIDLSGGL